MKKTYLLPALTVALVVAVGLAGCGSGPAASLNSFLSALRNADDSGATASCYDKESYKDLTEGLEGQVYGAKISVISVKEQGDQPVREKGYVARDVPTVEERMAAPLAEIEGRFKPLLDQANAVLSNATAEYNNAVAMKDYAAITYGRNMPQYYQEQVRINSAGPRMHSAQARVDELNAAKQAEIAALKAGAEEGFKKDKAAREKELASNSIELPTCEVSAKLVQGGSSQKCTFTLVEDGKWKVYSLSTPTKV
ncbi:MAG: hypothetical protein ACYC99_07475 [Candidatus Geothermincolia bacterium]